MSHGAGTGAVRGLPRILLRLEGLVFLAVGLFLYSAQGRGWWLFAGLFLAPDLSMLAYLAGPRLGAVLYDAVHTYVAPALIGAAAWTLDSPAGLALAFAWFGHIGFDRLLGLGLKYPAGFRDTHLGRIGRAVRVGGAAGGEPA